MELLELRHSKYFDFVVARLSHNNDNDYSLEELTYFDTLNPQLLIHVINAFEDDWYIETSYFEQHTTKEILNYLYATHEYYSVSVLPSIERLIFNLIKENYGNPMVREFRNSYSDFKKEFMHHLKQEEKIVFPYIELLMQGNQEIIKLLTQVDVLSLLTHDHDPPELHPFFGWVRGLRKMKISGIHEILKLEIIINKFCRDLKIHAFIEEEVLYFKSTQLLIGSRMCEVCRVDRGGAPLYLMRFIVKT